jgi:TM2 domain-containing membrane protein YozV
MAKKKARKSVKSNGGVRNVNWVLCLVMSVFVGWAGVDRYLMGKVGTGLLKLFTFGGLGIWWLVDIILIATKHQYKNVKWVE